MARRNFELFAVSLLKPEALRVRTGAQVARVLDEAGIRRGVLLSEAYIFASPHAVPERGDDVLKLTRDENAYTVQAALNSHGRLVAFISVNPLAPNALAEVRYWAGRPGVTGLKLHLANSGFKPQSAKDVATLARVVDLARSLNLPLVIHVRNAEAYARADAEIFIRQILPHAVGVPVQVAHAGGWGKIDEPALAAMGAYADAIARQAPGTQNLTFDLAVAAFPFSNRDLAMNRRFVGLMRRIGLKRFVVASDWPAISPRRNVEALEATLPLTPAEWRIVLSNRAPYLRP